MLTSIYPTDIESFTILKDASETAQYGSRGASGVIEITTKKGMSGKTQVSYNGIFGISTVYKNLKMLSADDFRRVASERGISILDKGNNTDFQKEIEQTGLQQNHHIAFYGGSNESSYRVSLGFMDRQGVILNEDMKNFTSNMNMTQRMFDVSELRTGHVRFYPEESQSGRPSENLSILPPLSIPHTPITKTPIPVHGTESLPPVRSRIRWHGWKYRIMTPPRISVLTLV